MGDLNLTREEMAALKAIDDELVRRLIENCLQEKRIHPLRVLRLERCGEFVASRQRVYEKALSDLDKAKAPKKVDEKGQRAQRAGASLDSAVQQMMHRAKTEEEERLLFFVEDLILPPMRFDERLSVQVRYQWRTVANDDWAHGSVTFSHVVVTRPDYSMQQPKRKPSAARQEQNRQEKLWREWDYLKNSSLHSVKEFLTNGGKGTDIPKSFNALVDSYSRGLNNHSTDFWL